MPIAQWKALQNPQTKYPLGLDLALRNLVPLSADHSLLSAPNHVLWVPYLLVLMLGTSISGSWIIGRKCHRKHTVCAVHMKCH